MTSEEESVRQERKSISSGISDRNETLQEFEDTGRQKKEEEKSYILEDQRHGPKRILFIPFDVFCELTFMVVAYFSIITSAAAIIGDDRIMVLKEKLRRKDNIKYFIIGRSRLQFNDF